MHEYDRENTIPESEEIKQELFEYLKDAEFGTVKFLAAFNAVEEHRLQAESSLFQQKLLESDNPESELHYQTLLFETSVEKALLKREIGGYRATKRGYQEAYQTILNSMDALADAASVEARIKFPEDEGENSLEFKRIYYSGWNRLTDEFYFDRKSDQ